MICSLPPTPEKPDDQPLFRCCSIWQNLASLSKNPNSKFSAPEFNSQGRNSPSFLQFPFRTGLRDDHLSKIQHPQTASNSKTNAVLGSYKFQQTFHPRLRNSYCLPQGHHENGRPLQLQSAPEQALSDFEHIKFILANAAALAKPHYSTPFRVVVSVVYDSQTANTCLYRQRQGERHVFGYDSIILDPTEQKAPPCTRFIAALAKLFQKTEMVVQKHQLFINTDHAVSSFIESSAFSITLG